MVSDALRGESVGKKMFEKAVEFARHKEIKIIPLCPFAQSMFSKNLEFHDVLQK
jgi:predicted GNAT family acetyltransferase